MLCNECLCFVKKPKQKPNSWTAAEWNAMTLFNNVLVPGHDVIHKNMVPLFWSVKRAKCLLNFTTHEDASPKLRGWKTIWRTMAQSAETCAETGRRLVCSTLTLACENRDWASLANGCNRKHCGGICHVMGAGKVWRKQQQKRTAYAEF